MVKQRHMTKVMFHSMNYVIFYSFDDEAFPGKFETERFVFAKIPCLAIVAPAFSPGLTDNQPAGATAP